MATFTKFNSFSEAVAEGVHNLGSHTLKIALTNSAPVVTNTVLANLTQITAANGYVVGGNAITITSSAQTSGTYKLVGDDVTFTASGGSIGPFRYVAIYNDTAAGDELIGFYDIGVATTITDGNSFIVDLNQSNGILTLA